MVRVLIVGAAGFVGKHMQRYLAPDFQVFATDKTTDIRDCGQVAAMIAHSEPDWVIHLAAVSHVGESFERPYETYAVNFTGTLNLLMGLRDAGFKGRLLYVGSSQVYGVQPPHEPPMVETRVLKPVNPYAVSKLAAESLCYQWSQTEDFEIVMVRPFNHIGPGQSESFVIPDFARQIAEIKAGVRPAVLEVGNIDVYRDFTDVRDVTVAYRLALEKGRSGEVYNVCSGREILIREVIELLLEIAETQAEIRHGSGRYRVADQVRMVGNAEKFCTATGWKPQIPLRESLKAILDYYLQAVA
jgi:GDP-4-dehydro-6-deoxy-D-mannose reductase